MRFLERIVKQRHTLSEEANYSAYLTFTRVCLFLCEKVMNLRNVIESYGHKETLQERKLDGKNGHVYYLKLEYMGRTWYKVGYTAAPIARRVKGMKAIAGVKLTLVDRYYFRKLIDAYNMEQFIHEKFKEIRYKHTKAEGFKIIKSGISELYEKDILEINNGTRYGLSL